MPRRRSMIGILPGVAEDGGPSSASKKCGNGGSSKNGIGGLNGFLDGKNVKLKATGAKVTDDMKSVVTFSAEDKDQKVFEQMAAQVSSKNVALQIRELTESQLCDLSDDEYEELMKEDSAASKLTRTCRKKKGLDMFLKSPATGGKLKASCDADDIKSVITFSSVDRDRDQFTNLAMQVSAANPTLSDDILRNQSEVNQIGVPIQPPPRGMIAANPKDKRSPFNKRGSTSRPNGGTSTKETPATTKKKVGQKPSTVRAEGQPAVKAPAPSLKKKKVARRRSSLGSGPAPSPPTAPVVVRKKLIRRSSTSGAANSPTIRAARQVSGQPPSETNRRGSTVTRKKIVKKKIIKVPGTGEVPSSAKRAVQKKRVMKGAQGKSLALRKAPAL